MCILHENFPFVIDELMEGEVGLGNSRGKVDKENQKW